MSHDSIQIEIQDMPRLHSPPMNKSQNLLRSNRFYAIPVITSCHRLYVRSTSICSTVEQLKTVSIVTWTFCSQINLIGPVELHAYINAHPLLPNLFSPYNLSCNKGYSSYLLTSFRVIA